MERIKIHSKVEFPRYLDMAEYIEPELQKKKLDELVQRLKAGTLFQEKDEDMEDNDDDEEEEDNIDISLKKEEKEEPADTEEPPKGDHIYELYSILIHSGGADSGHYYAYIKVILHFTSYIFFLYKILKHIFSRILKIENGTILMIVLLPH